MIVHIPVLISDECKKTNLLNEINIYFLNMYAEHTGLLSYDLVYRTRRDRIMSAVKGESADRDVGNLR